MATDEEKNKDKDEEEDDEDEDDGSEEEEDEEEDDDNEEQESEANNEPANSKRRDSNKEGTKEENDEDDNQDEDLALDEKLIEGFLNVQEENDKGKFVSSKKYYAKFLFKGRFLAFFTSQELKNIPVFYLKLKYILSIEDFYNNNPAMVFIEFYDGKKESRILLVIPALKEKEKWVDTITEQNDMHEDDEENEDEDFGRSQLETRYLLAEEYESILKRFYAVRKVKELRL